MLVLRGRCSRNGFDIFQITEQGGGLTMRQRMWVKRLLVFVTALLSTLFLFGCYVPDAVRTADGRAQVLKYRPAPSFKITIQNNRFSDGAELKLDGSVIARIPFGESSTVQLTPYFGNIEREADLLVTGKSGDNVPQSCVRHYRFRADDARTETWILDARSSECGGRWYHSASRSNAVTPAPVPAVLGVIDIRNETAVAIRISESLPDGKKKELLALSQGERYQLQIRGEEISLAAMIGNSVVLERRTFSFVSRAAPAAVIWSVRATTERRDVVPQSQPRRGRSCRPGSRTAC